MYKYYNIVGLRTSVYTRLEQISPPDVQPKSAISPKKTDLMRIHYPRRAMPGIPYAVSCKSVPNSLSRCHTKIRMDGCYITP